MNEAGGGLEQRLLEAHGRDDPTELSALYAEAADLKEAEGDVEATCFYLTHAFVFALQAGDDTADALQERLWRFGREVRPSRKF